tara:strand:+ start:1438 stop:1989 length:552 start_codon:yes stop_codon:yes gene_type:complete
LKLIKSTLEQKIQLTKERRSMRKNFVESTDFRTFLVDCYLYLNPSSYGTKIQERFRKDNGWGKVKASDNRGDYKTEKDYVEFKVSYLGVMDTYTLKHIRPWQELDRYHVVLIDSSFDYTIYDIPKNDMNEFVHKYGSACNGTSTANSKNEKVEYGWDFKNNNLYQLENFVMKPSTKINKFFEF